MNSLKFIALILGFGSFCGGLWALNSPEKAQRFARELPRNQPLGRILMAINVAWSLWLLHPLRMGSWEWIKIWLYWGGPVFYWLIITQANDYLGARAVAWLLILAAKPILNVCFLRDEPSRLVLTTLAYLWVVAGIIIMAAPHWMRDFINFIRTRPERWNWHCRFKIALGALLIVLGFIVY